MNNPLEQILINYNAFIEKSISHRFFKHADILPLLQKLPKDFEIKSVGFSTEKRNINLVKWGEGNIKVFLWSQMHGDEATGTMALFDLFNFLQNEQFKEITKLIAENCQLYIMPLVNPDGAERFTRRNAQQIDVNRDFLQTRTKEAKILRAIRDEIKPAFGFNLHDQSTLWSVAAAGKPATLSYLAPAFNETLDVDPTRKNAMLVIANIFESLNIYLPEQIGLFDDEHEPRAFGDNFQKEGTSTILIEAGGLKGDEEKQKIREYYFLSILKGLISIASRSYKNKTIDDYFSIPKNSKKLYHIIVKDIDLDGIKVDISLNYEDNPNINGTAVDKKYTIKDIGDLSTFNAYQFFTDHYIKGDIILDEPAHFDLFKNNELILSFKNGILHP